MLKCHPSPSLRTATFVFATLGEGWCECRESNPDHQLRRRIHYPLCYTRKITKAQHFAGPSVFKMFVSTLCVHPGNSVRDLDDLGHRLADFLEKVLEPRL